MSGARYSLNWELRQVRLKGGGTWYQARLGECVISCDTPEARDRAIADRERALAGAAVIVRAAECPECGGPCSPGSPGVMHWAAVVAASVGGYLADDEFLALMGMAPTQPEPVPGDLIRIG